MKYIFTESLLGAIGFVRFIVRQDWNFWGWDAQSESIHIHIKNERYFSASELRVPDLCLVSILASPGWPALLGFWDQYIYTFFFQFFAFKGGGIKTTPLSLDLYLNCDLNEHEGSSCCRNYPVQIEQAFEEKETSS